MLMPFEEWTSWDGDVSRAIPTGPVMVRLRDGSESTTVFDAKEYWWEHGRDSRRGKESYDIVAYRKV